MLRPYIKPGRALEEELPEHGLRRLPEDLLGLAILPPRPGCATALMGRIALGFMQGLKGSCDRLVHGSVRTEELLGAFGLAAWA